MSWIAVIGIACGLALDAFAVSIASGMAVRSLTSRRVFRLAFHFGLFQFFMPVVGWAAGQAVSGYIQAIDHWIAFGLLGFVGGKMLWEAWKRHGDTERGDPTRGMLLVTLSVATSIDALAVGLSLGVLGVSIWLPSVVIGVVCATLTAVGMWTGCRFGDRLGRWAEVAGAIVLLAIGTRILISHLLGN